MSAEATQGAEHVLTPSGYIAEHLQNFNSVGGKQHSVVDFSVINYDTVFWSVTGKYRFYGLTKTSLSLEGLDTHRRLVDSYKKIHAARKNKIL